MALISNRSPPAMNEPALPEAKMRALGRGCRFSTASTASASSWTSLSVIELTFLPGWSNQRVTTLSASVVIRIVSMVALRSGRWWGGGVVGYSATPPLNHFLLPFQQHRRALAAADAQGGDGAVDVAALHFVQQREHEPGARGADRVAERDAAAVHVQPLQVQLAHCLVTAEVLAAERVRCRRPRSRRQSPCRTARTPGRSRP